MALTLPSFDLPSGITVSDAYGLITGFRLLSDRSLEIELSIWKDSQACGLGLSRIGSRVFHVGQDNSSYQQLFNVVATALYSHVQAEIAADEYIGETVYPGSLIIPQEE